MHNKNEEANNNTSCSHGKSTDRESMEKLEKEIEALRQNNSELSRALADARIQIGDYRQREMELQKDILDIKEKTFNQIRSMMQTIEGNTKEILTNFLTVSDNLSTVLHVCNLFNAQMGIMNKSNRSVEQQQQVRATHAIVKPQIVNGHVLQNPTITLTRTEVPQQSTHRLSREEAQVETETNSYSSLDHESVEPNGQTENISVDNMELNTSSSPNALHQRLSTLVEEDENVIENGESSTANTTLTPKSVISGIFHDVKIYLNQLPMDVINSNLNQSTNNINNLSNSSNLSSLINTLKKEATNRRMTVALSSAITNGDSNDSMMNESTMTNSKIIEEKSNPLEFITVKRGQHFQSVSPENSFSSLTPAGSSTPFHVSRDRFSISLRSDIGVTKRRRVSSRIQNNSDSNSESCNVSDSSKNKPKKQRRKRIVSPESSSDDDKSIRTSQRLLNKSSESKKDGKQSSLSNSNDKRPKRAARPRNLKEPKLNKKMRR